MEEAKLTKSLKNPDQGQDAEKIHQEPESFASFQNQFPLSPNNQHGFSSQLATMNQTRENTNDSRMKLLQSALGQERIENNETPPMPPLEGQLIHNGAAAAATLSPSTPSHYATGLQGDQATIASLQARNKTLKMQLEASRQEITKLREQLQQQTEEALVRHNDLQARFIEYIQRNKEEKRKLRDQQAASSSPTTHRQLSGAGTNTTDEQLLSLLSEVNRNHQRAMQYNGIAQDRHRRQQEELMGKPAQTLLESCMSTSPRRGGGQDQPFSPPRNETSQHSRAEARMDPSSPLERDELIRAQFELQRLEKKLESLKRRCLRCLEEEVEELRMQKRRRQGL